MLKNEEQPLISILIPTYNRGKLLTKAIESAINQTYKNLEIIIADNCSEDNTQLICEEYSKKDDRIKYYRHNTNIGPFANANFLFRNINGKYFTCLNDDDWLDIDYIEQSFDTLINNPGYTFVSPSIVLYYKTYSRYKNCYVPELNQNSPAQRIQEFLKSYWISDIVTGLFRTDIIKNMMEIDNYCCITRLPEDIIFMLKFLSAGKAKVINTTHYNKLNNGSTRILSCTPNEFYSNNDYIYTTKMQNFHSCCANNVIKSLKNDKIFSYYLTKNDIDEISKIVYKTLYIDIKKYNLRLRRKNIKRYIKRHPLFFIKKSFYWAIKRYSIAKHNYKFAIKDYKKIFEVENEKY